MNKLISAYRILFHILTPVVLVVTIVACLTDVFADTRRFWIGATIAVLSVMCFWREK